MWDGETAVPLYDYQRRWIEDESRYKLAVKSTQIGFSFAGSLDSVLHCVDPRNKANEIVLSRSDRQAREFAEKAKEHCQALQIADTVLETGFFENTSLLQHEIKFGNGRRIIVLTSNPDTARGYTGNVTLDEFGFHLDAAKVWAAAFGRASRGGLKVRVISTPNGQRGKYFDLAKLLDLIKGIAPALQPVKAGGWSGHWVDIFAAVAAGCPMVPAELKEAIGDDDTWMQEYLCIFLSESQNFIPMELILQAVSSDCSVQVEPGWVPQGPLFFGYDVARRRDLSCLFINEQLGDTFWGRVLVRLKGQKFSVQKQAVRGAAEICLRGCIDETGLGAQMAEEMADEYPGRVEPVTFTAAVKQDLAFRVKARLEDRQQRLPDDRDLHRAVNAVKRMMTAAGNVRFDAERTALGHADEFWALALALHAADAGDIVGAPDVVSSGVLREHARVAGAY